MLAIMGRSRSRAWAVIAIAIAPLMVLANVRYMMPMAERGYDRQEAEGRIYRSVERALTANPVVQASPERSPKMCASASRRRRRWRPRSATTERPVPLQDRARSGAGDRERRCPVGRRDTVLGGRPHGRGMLVFFAYLATLYGRWSRSSIRRRRSARRPGAFGVCWRSSTQRPRWRSARRAGVAAGAGPRPDRGRRLRLRARPAGAARRDAGGAAGRDGGAGGPDRGGQEHAREPRAALLRPVARAGSRSTATTCAT